jgi:ketosteroid isomerase-like protein
VAKDLDALGESVTEDVVYEMPLHESGDTQPEAARRYSGKKQLIDFWTGAFPSFPTRHEPEDVEVIISSDGNFLFLEQWGDFTVADGRSYRNRYVFRLTIFNGKVAHIREYFNPVTLAQAMGFKVG